MAKSHAMTPARRAALKKAQAASARKRRGKGKGKLASANRRIDTGRKNRRRAGYAAAGAVAAAGIGYVAYRGVKHKIQSDFRSDVRSNLSRDKQHQHNQVHHHAIRQRRAGKGNRHLDPRVLDAQIVFTKKIAKARVKKRKGMTSAQRRASIPKRRRLI